MRPPCTSRRPTPPGQRHEPPGTPSARRKLYYYAGLPVAQIASSPGAAKASLHKARRRLSEHITTHRPDLIPVLSRRTPMTTVRIACAQPHLDTTPDGSIAIAHILVVLADEPGHRAMGLWLRTRQGMALWRVLDRTARDTEPSRPPHGLPGGGLPVREFTPEGLAIRLLGAAGGTVTGVDIDELGPNVLAAQVGVASPAGTRQVTADPGSALALAAALEVPVRVADALLDRLAVPVTGDDLLASFVSPTGPSGRAALRAAEPGLRRRPGRLDHRRQLPGRGHRGALGRLHRSGRRRRRDPGRRRPAPLRGHLPRPGVPRQRLPRHHGDLAR
jgi:hypothetical protein